MFFPKKPFLFAVLIFLSSAVWSGAVSGLDVGNTVYDFGTVSQGETVTHSFTFENSGKDPLRIDRLKTSCGCTAALLSAKTIPAGEQGSIRTTFDSSRFRGPIQKFIYLYPASPQGEPVKFTLKGVVKPIVETQPLQVDFGRVEEGQSVEKKLVLLNTGQQKLEIRNIRTSNTALRATSEAETLAPGVETEFRVVAEPVSETRHLNGYVLVRTDQASLGELRIPVRGYIER